jgi:hypothetical protein
LECTHSGRLTHARSKDLATIRRMLATFLWLDSREPASFDARI